MNITARRRTTLAIAGVLLSLSLPLYSQQNGEVPEDILDAIDQQKTKLRLIQPDMEMPVIVIDAGASESIRFAAKELADHLQKMTGRALHIVHAGSELSGRKVIALGKSAATNGVDAASLGIEQYAISITPEGLSIVGGSEEATTNPDGSISARDRGTLYGVYDFLESLGVRWYRPEPWGWYIPERKVIELPLRKTVSKVPDFTGRCAVRIEARWDKASPEYDELTELWAARQRLNVRTSKKPKYGGWVAIGLNHAQARIISPAKYGKKHPEFFALVNGKRGNPGSGKLPQLCLGNPELQETFAREVIQRAKADPYAASISIDPEDGTHAERRMCQCELCKAMDDPANPGVMSNRVFAFANIIARKLAAEVPDAKVGLYAYSMHTEPPTRVERMEPNVIVGFANINSWSDWTKPLRDSASQQNAQFLKLVSDWKRLLQHRPWMREYSAYGWMGPIPMTHLLQDRVKTYRELGIEGLEWPGEPNWGSQLPLLYFKAQLQWNPDLDLNQELALFYHNYYGPAAEPMKAYHERWMAAFEGSRLGQGLQSGVSSGGRGIHLLCTPALMSELGGSIDEAKKKVAGQELYERRLRGTEAGFQFARKVSEILSQKLTDGREERTPGGTIFLESASATASWGALKEWMLKANEEDLAFEVSTREGAPYAVALDYMARDILKNGRFSESAERSLLETNGFGEKASPSSTGGNE